MLGRNFRFSVNNQAGVAVDVAIQARPWKFDSNGALVYGSEVQFFNQTGIASGTSWTVDTPIDNSSDLWIGADLEITYTPAASATGIVSVRIQRSTDGGTTWPSGGGGEPIASYYFSASSAAFTQSVQI